MDTARVSNIQTPMSTRGATSLNHLYIARRSQPDSRG
jgi:hypothetical protein